MGTAGPNTSTSNLGAANARPSSLESVSTSVSTSNPEANPERTYTTGLNNTLPDEEDDMEGKISCGKFEYSGDVSTLGSRWQDWL